MSLRDQSANSAESILIALTHSSAPPWSADTAFAFRTTLCAIVYLSASGIPAVAQMAPLWSSMGISTIPFGAEAEPAKLVPSEKGVPEASGGESVQWLRADILYVSARLPEPTGRFVARLTGRNPNWEEEDALRILAGANIGYTDRIVQVNPLGLTRLKRPFTPSIRVSRSSRMRMNGSDPFFIGMPISFSSRSRAATTNGMRRWRSP